MKKMQFNEHVYETTLGGRKLVIETGKYASFPTVPAWCVMATPPCWST